MGWPILWIPAALLAGLALLASLGSIRFSRRVARDIRAMKKASSGALPVSRRRKDLPAPVERYIAKALGEGDRVVGTARVLQGGTFCPKLDGTWLPIRARQYFSANPPGFVWWGRVRIAPGVWIDAHDRSVVGAARMQVALESTIRFADSTGPELDQSALQRLLGELVWLPSAFLDERFVTWEPIDDRHARATLRLNGREATGLFEFSDEDLPVRFSADRYRDLGGGKAVLTPFTAECGDYRPENGVVVPHDVNGFWHVGDRWIPFARFRVERVEFDAAMG